MSIAVSSRQYEDEIDLLRYGRFLGSYWRLLAGGAVAGAIALVALASVIPARYQATATLTVIQPAGVAPLVLTPAAAKAFLASSTLISETIGELGLDRDGITAQTFVDDALDVQPLPQTTLVKLKVTLRDATKARLAANLLATKVVESSRRIDREGAISSSAALGQEVTQSAINLNLVAAALIAFEMKANVEKLAADIQSLEQQRLETDAQRAELYRRRLEIERLHADYMERTRFHTDLSMRYEEARLRPGGRPQIQIVDPAVQPDRPLSKRRPQFGMLGSLIGLLGGVVAALLVNKRRVERAAGS